MWLLIIAGSVIFIAASFIAAIKFLLPYALGGCVLGTVAQNFFDRYKETGACALTDQEIIVASGEEITKYPLSAITDLKLHFLGYWGMELKPTRMRGGDMPNYSDGAMNSLVFRYKGEEVKIGLMFYRQHLSAMNTLLTMWEEQGITCELYGRKNVERRRFRI